MRGEFLSWIPCISGELFFSKTEHGLGVYDFYHINIAYRSSYSGKFVGRLVVASSVVDWQDTSLLTKPNIGLHRVVVVATSNDYRHLSGVAFIIEKNLGSGSSARLLDRYRPQVDCERERDILRLLAALEARFGRGTTIETEADGGMAEALEYYEQLVLALEQIEESAVHCVSFSIHTTGITKTSFQYSKCRRTSASLSLDIKQTIHAQRNICAHVFHYLKYLLHKHVHHSADNDALTTVHTFKNSPIANADSLVRDIKRGIIDEKRGANHTRYSPAGIAVYGASLINSLDVVGWFDQSSSSSHELFDTKTTIVPTLQQNQNYVENLRKSLDLLKQERKEHRDQAFWRTYGKLFVSNVLWWIAIIGPLLIYLNIFSSRGELLHLQLVEYRNRFCEGSWIPFVDNACAGLFQIGLTYVGPNIVAPAQLILLLVGLSVISAGMCVRWTDYSLTEWILSQPNGHNTNASVSPARAMLLLYSRKVRKRLYQPIENDWWNRIRYLAVIFFAAFGTISTYAGFKYLLGG